MPGDSFWVVVLGGAGIAAGLWLLTRGMAGFRRASRIADTSTSQIASAAAGEVRVSGIVEPAELLLTSPLQSAACVFYRSRVDEADEDRGSSPFGDQVFTDERAVAFRLRDASGSIRVFPRGAHFDVPDRFEGSGNLLGDAPAGLNLRVGDAVSMARPDRATMIEQLLTVQPPCTGGALSDLAPAGASANRRRRYREARIEPDDTVTIVGRLIPFSDLPDPLGASDVTAVLDPYSALADPEIAADVAAARAAGILETDAAEAWGNAAIPGFGIGRPVRPPELDPAATPRPLASEDEARRIEELFEIEHDELVLAAVPDWPLIIAAGSPGAAVQRQEQEFLIGLLGALLAIASAVVVALALSGVLAT